MDSRWRDVDGRVRPGRVFGVSSDYLAALGARRALGPLFGPDPDVIGRVIPLGEIAVDIVVVMPRKFGVLSAVISVQASAPAATT